MGVNLNFDIQVVKHTVDSLNSDFKITTSLEKSGSVHNSYQLLLSNINFMCLAMSVLKNLHFVSMLSLSPVKLSFILNDEFS